MRARLWMISLAVLACNDGGPSADQQVDGRVLDPDSDVLERPEVEPFDPVRDGGMVDLDAADPDGARPMTPRVEVDLSPYTQGEAGRVAVRRIESADDLIGGPAAQGRVGDYLLENDQVRLIVEQAYRASAVCPWGGNIIDADVQRDCEGACGQDVVGEVCLVLMLSQTMSPDTYEILADGSEGAAVLAVSGSPQLADFVNIPGIVGGFLPGVMLGYDTETLLQARITQYYVLRPGDHGARVITAIRNDGDATIHTPIAHLLDSGGVVDFFSPLGPFGGFGYDNLGPESLAGTRLTYLAFQGEDSGWGFMPEPIEGLGEEDYPISGVYVSVSGVAVSLLNTTNVVGTLLARPPQQETLEALAHIAPGETHTFSHWHWVSDASLSSAADQAWPALGVETGTVRGTVMDGETPVEGARVSVLDAEGRTLTQARSGADGSFEMQSPRGEMTVRAWHPGRRPITQAVTVGAAPAEVMLAAETPGRLRVRVILPDGSPIPGKVVISCGGEDCPDGASTNDLDNNFDRVPTQAGRLLYASIDGVVEAPLPPGTYEVSVTRGPEWSVWPPDVVANGGTGASVEVVAGETAEVTAEIAQVVDTAGAISADFHVHAINSPDAPVANRERVRTFLGEGVDVLVSTDHDYITDFAPIIEEMGVGAQLASVIGEEITTFDYGHFNAFPLNRDPAERNGGALDWSGAEGPGLSPDAIMEWAHDHPGEQVVQANHAMSSFGVWQVDFLTGETFADPSVFRIGGLETDPETGDTGLFTEKFTAMELLNDAGVGDFWGLTRWWLTMIGRGMVRTGTAVSDTHKRARTQAGEARSWVFVEGDTPATLDLEAFAQAINAGRLVGSNAPFFRVTATSGEATAGPGDTLALTDGQATLTVTLDLPEWLHVDTIDIYQSVTEGIIHAPGQLVAEELPPTRSIPVTLAEDQLQVVAEGTVQHRHRVISINVEIESATDGYVVVMVRSKQDGGQPIYPVSLSTSVRPLAFANPILLDADGNGYDNPPLAGMVQKKRRVITPPVRRFLDRASFIELLERTAHDH